MLIGFAKFDIWSHREFAGNEDTIVLSVMPKW
jgi:hypothetical protein